MKTKTRILLSISFFVIYYFVFLINGTDNYILIHDILDGDIISRIMMNYPDNSPLMADGIINTVQNGLPRSALQSDLNVTTWLFGLFSPWTAYVINDIFARVIGFIGMTLLLNRLINHDTKYGQWITLIISIIFATLGSYNTYSSLTFMGLPLILWLFYNLYKRNMQWYYYAIIVAFAFCSSLPLVGVFIIASLGLWWLIDYIKTRSFNTHFFVALIVLTLSYIVIEYQMVLSFLSEDFISHRTEFQETTSVSSILIHTFKSIFLTQYHGGSMLTLPIIALFGYNLILTKKLSKQLRLISIIIVAIFFWQCSYHLLKQTFDIDILKAFQFDRFYFFLPLLWLLLGAFSTEGILNLPSNKKQIQNVIICTSMLGLTALSAIYNNIELKLNMYSLVNHKVTTPSYNEFFDATLFDQISDHIGQPKQDYRVVSIGMHPSIAIFNGFFALDTYQSNYLLEYKHQFRQIIAKELDKNPIIKDYFDNWGNRCYILTAENLGNYFISKHDELPIKNLDINTAILKDMGCEYIFSTTKIDNEQQINITLEKVFEGRYWRIYLYKL